MKPSMDRVLVVKLSVALYVIAAFEQCLYLLCTVLGHSLAVVLCMVTPGCTSVYQCVIWHVFVCRVPPAGQGQQKTKRLDLFTNFPHFTLKLFFSFFFYLIGIQALFSQPLKFRSKLFLMSEVQQSIERISHVRKCVHVIGIPLTVI